MVDPDGNVINLSTHGIAYIQWKTPWNHFVREENCDDLGHAVAGSVFSWNDGFEEFGVNHKYVYVGRSADWLGELPSRSNRYGRDIKNNRKREEMKYNFETGMWVNRWGEKYQGGKLVE